MKHVMLYRVDHTYSSHANIAMLQNGDWVVVFSHSCRRKPPIVHPPNDPFFVNMLMRSQDQGKTWNLPRVVPDYSWMGMENPGIMQLKNGDVLLNQWRYLWYPTEVGYKIWKSGERPVYTCDLNVFGNWKLAQTEEDWKLHESSPFSWVRADDSAYVQISHDNGRTFEESVKLDTSPYLGAFSPKGAIEMDNGEVILSLGSQDHDPLQASFVLISGDGGKTWSKTIEAAREKGKSFFEPSTVQTKSGKLLMVLREEIGGYVHTCESFDHGRTWQNLRQLELWGYPSHAIRLKNDNILIVYGRRKTPHGIRVAVSRDEGATWSQEIVLRDDLDGKDLAYNLGYPSVIEYEPNRLFSVYYGEDKDGLTCVQGTYFDINDKGELV